jgi:HEAT repeat protein
LRNQLIETGNAYLKKNNLTDGAYSSRIVAIDGNRGSSTLRLLPKGERKTFGSRPKSPMNKLRGAAASEEPWVAMLFMLLVGTVVLADSDSLPINIIDFYGVRKVSRGDARAALTFKEGDTITFGDDDKRPAMLESSEKRLAKLPDVVKAGEEFSEAQSSAVQRGDFVEDRTKGHSLMHDPAARAIQEQFIVFAQRDLPLLRRVLRNASDPVHRALAAQVLAYAADKQSVVEDLVRAMSDPADEVRNNAMRALAVFAEAVPDSKTTIPRIPAAAFLAFLNSPIWSDRNKAALALATLSARRDKSVLREIRESALVPLAEMARWKSTGHAQTAFMILARVAGYSDEAATALWDQGKREVVIQAAIGGR